MRTFILLKIIFITCGLFGQLTAQDYTIDVQTYGIENGLLHRDVQTVFEDKNGFIWIGGYKGLQRYDGHDFKTWTKADKSGLIYYISGIGQDDAGWLWLWNNDLQKFVFLHPETEEILTVEERFGDEFPFSKDNDAKSRWSNGRSRIPTNQSGQLLFGTNKGEIISFDSKNHFQSLPFKKDFDISIEFVDKHNNLWVTSYENGLYKLNVEGQILYNYPSGEGVNLGAFSYWKEEVYFHESYDLATINKPFSKMMKINTAGETQFLKESLKSWLILDGNFWCNNPEVGWEIYSVEQSKQLYVLEKKDYSHSLFDVSHAPFQDSRGNFWIYGNLGLHKVKFQKSRFQKYFAFEQENEKPFSNAARGIWVDEDSIFVNFERSVTVRTNRQNSEDWQILNNKEWARPLLKEKTGNMLIGYPFSVKSMTTSGEVTQTFQSEYSISGIWSFYEADNGNIWIGTGDKLVVKNKNDSVLKAYELADDVFGFATRRGAIQNMIREENGLVWFCSWTGLYLFDTKTEKILARYASDEKGEFYLPADLFYYIYKDNEGIYWIGTSEGIIRWKGDGGRFMASDKRVSEGNADNMDYRLFSRKDGLSNDVIYAIFEDDHNRLWLSSDYGIMSFDKTTFDVKTYLEKDGISHHEFNRTSQFKAEDGTVYFGGLNGITAFHPDDFVEDEKDQVQMLVSDYEIFDGEQNELVNRVGELRSTNAINFYPDDRFFRLKFVLPTFEDNSRMLYAWKVEGVDADWNYQKENSLQIGVLPYGNHLLRIKGQNATGGWSPHELVIQVNVFKPFYLQIWFVVFVLLGIILAAYLFYRRRTRLLKKTQKLLETEIERATSKIEAQAAELREMDKVKTRFFANVSHELRTPITLIQGPIQSALKSQKLDNRNFTLLYKAKENTKKLLQLVNEILDLTKLDAHKLELDETTVVLYTFLKRIVSNFESYAASESLELLFVYNSQPELQIKIDVNKLEKILNNLLTNAFKFTPKGGQIMVTIEDVGRDLKLSVKDTGRGIPAKDLPHIFNRFYQSSQNTKAEGGLGIGLALSMEYVKLMNGNMWVESSTESSEQGSMFFVQFPKKEVISMLSTEDAMALKQLNESPVKTNLSSQNVPVSTPEHTILVVEDNPDLREYISFLLSPYYHVLMAENGQAGMALLNDKLRIMNEKSNMNQSLFVLPHLIISDIMMPIMDGYEFLETVKNEDAFRHIPIIMLTARAELKDRLKALRIGVDDYLLKPFDEEELLTRIDNLLQNYQERQAQMSKLTKVSTKPVQEDVSQKADVEISNAAFIKTTKEDQVWLKTLEEILTRNISNTQYSITQFADDLAISERQLRRRIKQLTGLSTLHYFKEIRLQKARQLLEERQYKTIAQTASAVGFQNPKTFSRNFAHRFGKMPSEYLNS